MVKLFWLSKLQFFQFVTIYSKWRVWFGLPYLLRFAHALISVTEIISSLVTQAHL